MESMHDIYVKEGIDTVPHELLGRIDDKVVEYNECSRCGRQVEVSSNACPHCGMEFIMNQYNGT